VNERIRVREVRLIDENGAQAGVVPIADALSRARAAGEDLIEVAPNVNPPVCRIMDYGKYKYQQQKRDKEGRKKHRASQLRMITVRSPRIDPHDFETKLKSVRKFLEDGDKVRISLRFRYRELSHPEFGQRVMDQFAERCLDVALVERPAQREGRILTMVLVPKPGAVVKKPAPEEREPTQPEAEASVAKKPAPQEREQRPDAEALPAGES